MQRPGQAWGSSLWNRSTLSLRRESLIGLELSLGLGWLAGGEAGWAGWLAVRQAGVAGSEAWGSVLGPQH